MTAAVAAVGRAPSGETAAAVWRSAQCTCGQLTFVGGVLAPCCTTACAEHASMLRYMPRMAAMIQGPAVASVQAQVGVALERAGGCACASHECARAPLAGWRPGCQGMEPGSIRALTACAVLPQVPVNWCPELGTVLANEEVVDGVSERGGFPVVRLPMKQWMLRITRYADRLLEDLDTLDWPDSIKEMQRNWIGRSEGARISFQVSPWPSHCAPLWLHAHCALALLPGLVRAAWCAAVLVTFPQQVCFPWDGSVVRQIAQRMEAAVVAVCAALHHLLSPPASRSQRATACRSS